MPGHVEIGGVVYKCRLVRRLPGDCVGEADPKRQLLRVERTGLDSERATAMHELIHAILIESGLDGLLGVKMDEAVATAVSGGLCRALSAGGWTDHGRLILPSYKNETRNHPDRSGNNG